MHPRRGAPGGTRRERGSMLVEAAVVLPLLLLLLFAITEFGRLFYTKITVESAVRQAARFAVTGNLLEDPGSPGNDLSREDGIKQYVVTHAAGVTVDPSRITVEPLGGGGPGDLVKVTAEHTFRFVAPIVGRFFDDGEYTFTYTATMKNEPLFTEKRRS